MQTSARVHIWILSMFIVSLGLGCGARPTPTIEPSPTSQLSVHNAGTIMSGDTVRHTFSLLNDTPLQLNLSDKDISRSCGCSDANVFPRQLPPQGRARVTVELDSSNKVGELAEVVKTRWRNPTGAVSEFVFGIRAIARTPLACAPAEISFSREEVAQGSQKNVTLTSDLELDWKSLKVQSDHDALKVRCIRSETSPQLLEVGCLPSPTGEPQQGHIMLTVFERGKESSHQATLPVFWHSPTQLRISPKTVSVRRQQHGWTTTFVITGNKIREGIELQKIQVGKETLHFELHQIGQFANRVDLTIESDQFGSLPKEVTLCFSDGTTNFLSLIPPSLP